MLLAVPATMEVMAATPVGQVERVEAKVAPAAETAAEERAAAEPCTRSPYSRSPAD